jgi:hypothetical protein
VTRQVSALVLLIPIRRFSFVLHRYLIAFLPRYVLNFSPFLCFITQFIYLNPLIIIKRRTIAHLYLLPVKWHQLYCLENFGSDFAAILETILGYNGPLIFIISARGGGMFGAFTSAQWKLSGDFFGDGDSFLFCIDPCVKVYRPTGNRRNYMYCNPSSRTSYNDGKAHGIGFGGTTDSPRLFIPESSLLDNDTHCRAGSYDTTYEQGTILPEGGGNSMHLTDRFQIENLEIWGLGGDDTFEKAIQARDFQRSIMSANVRKAQTIVNKFTFMDDLTAGFVNTKLWEHRDHITKREACD